VLGSGSRAAWIGYGVAFATLSVLVSSRRAIVSIVWLTIGVALITWVATDAEVQHWLLPRGDSFRPAIWSSTFDAVRHGHWLFGAGMLAHHTSIQAGYVIAHPHSVYLATLFHGGIIAAALLLGVLLLALVRGFRWRSDWIARTAVTLLAFAVPALALDGSALIDKVGYLWLLLWTPLAWLIALGRPTEPAPQLR
jgi:O-Antigen ligase